MERKGRNPESKWKVKEKSPEHAVGCRHRADAAQPC